MLLYFKEMTVIKSMRQLRLILGCTSFESLKCKKRVTFLMRVGTHVLQRVLQSIK